MKTKPLHIAKPYGDKLGKWKSLVERKKDKHACTQITKKLLTTFTSFLNVYYFYSAFVVGVCPTFKVLYF